MPNKSGKTFGEQIQDAFFKAQKAKNYEAMAYYHLLPASSPACVSFETFKGSWAYDEWLNRPDVQEYIEKHTPISLTSE